MEENKIYYIHTDKNILDVLFDKELAENTCKYINDGNEESWVKSKVTEVTYEGIYDDSKASNIILTVCRNGTPWKTCINDGIRQEELIVKYDQCRDEYCVYEIKTLIM